MKPRNGFSLIDSSFLLPCYNPSCVRNRPSKKFFKLIFFFLDVFTSEQPARAKPPSIKRELSPHSTQSETNTFPYPKPYNFKRKSCNNGRTKESILILPNWLVSIQLSFS